MKKIFTLTLVFLAMMFGVNAQYLLQEGFETGTLPTGWTTVDADNDGYDWDASYLYQAGYAHSGDGLISSASYVSTALTPDNWLISPAVNLTANATLTFWVCAQDASWAGEHYGVYISTTGTATSNFTLLFEETLDANGGPRTQGAWKQKTVNLSSYTGQTVYIAFRHFNCTDMFHIDLDDVEIFVQPTDPTIVAQPTSLDFGTLAAGTSQTKTVNVVNYNLTTDVTATTTAPYSISADGNTFGTTATIAATGGTLYVKYAPTTVGTDNGTVTLSSTGATNVTISTTGAAIDCNATIPYTYAFDNEAQAMCWTIIDANNDGYTFGISTEDGLAYYSYNTTSDADDWLISPVFTLNGTHLASVDYAVASSSFPEKFQVFAIGSDTVALTSVMEITNTSLQTLYLDLTALTGNYQIAFHCVSDANQYELYFTNFNVFSNVATITVNPEDVDFGTIEMNTVSDVAEVGITAISITDPITLSVAAPFEISLDGTTFATTATIPAGTAMIANHTFYVRFAPTATGTFNQNVTVTAGTLSETVALTGGAVDCSTGIASLPFTFDFNNPVAPPLCWAIGYDPEVFFSAGTGTEGDYAIGIEGVDMLITPEIHSTDAMLVSFDYINYFGTEATAPTYFHVGYSTTDNNPSSFTWQSDNLCAVDAFTPFTTIVPAGTKYVAIGVSQLGSGLYWGMFELDDAFYIDNFSLTALTEALLTVTPESMSFGSIMLGSSSPAKTASVVGALLTSNITVTAPANFEVSTNGTSYAATASLPQDGGILYVRYNPSAAGNHNGTITLTSGNTSKTITVSGSAIDCSNPTSLPFYEDFESDLSGCWTILDEDGDGYSWMNSGMVAFEGDGCISSASYINDIGALFPDNWLITPTLSIPNQGAVLSFYVVAQDASYANEHYGVYVSTSGVAPSNFTLLYEEDLDADGGPRAQGTWKQKTVNLPYGGQNIHIAIRHFNVTDMFWMNIDNFRVTPGTGIENHEAYTKVYPNPANNVLNIDANCNINTIAIYNMMGQVVGTYNVNDVNTQINTTNFANGVYMVKIETENGTSTQKFTVAR